LLDEELRHYHDRCQYQFTSLLILLFGRNLAQLQPVNYVVHIKTNLNIPTPKPAVTVSWNNDDMVYMIL
jgi:hypothetical protein